MQTSIHNPAAPNPTVFQAPLAHPILEPIRVFEKNHGPLRFIMAPMSGITDTVFRQVIRGRGAQVVISDLISAEGIVRESERTLSMLKFSETERPLGIQIFGGEEHSLVESCRHVAGIGADFVDLNLGCPVKKVTKNGGGAAWLRDPSALQKLLTKMKNAVGIPLTIKIRTGWDSETINAAEVVQAAYDSGVSWVAIHGRTRAQGYSGLADWELIRKVAQNSPLPIIGNGDIIDARDAKNKIALGYANAVMIGRGALKNPWIFQEIQGYNPERSDLVNLIEQHFEIALSTKESQRALASLKKFCSWYAAGFVGASNFRRELFTTRDPNALRSLALNYFGDCDVRQRQNESGDFLMGGHG